MSVPQAYIDARDSLIALRTKILNALIAGRVKARLDAGHASMQKYGEVIDKLAITPYMFNNIKQKALALQLGTKNLGTGQISQAKADYVLPTVDYPIYTPHEVALRKLPQVDVFQYKIVTDIELLEKTNSAMFRSFFILQCANNTFDNQPDAENAVYDYYQMLPQRRVVGAYTLTNPKVGFEDYKTLKGEFVHLYRVLHKGSDAYVYWCNVLVDSQVFSTTAFLRNVGIAFEPFLRSSPDPEVVLNACGIRVPKYSGGMWMAGGGVETVEYTWFARIVEKGFGQIAEDADFSTTDTVWWNHFEVEIRVNESTWGYTTPVVGTYTERAEIDKQVQAFAQGGHSFDHWELDGINYGSVNPRTFPINKDCIIEAIFT